MNMKRTLMKGIAGALVVIVIALTLGCSGMSTRQQQALSGGAMGAAGGVVFGAIAGAPLTGALIGGAVGTATGALWEDLRKSLR